jgi:hypothetical protein
MGESYKKQIRVALLIIALLFVTFIVLAYCYFQFFQTKKMKKKEDFIVKFKTSDVLTIENKLPVTDVVGKSFDGTSTEEGIQGYVEFSVENPNKEKNEYAILLTKQSLDEEILDRYINFYLTDEKDIPFKGFDKNHIPSYSDLYSFSSRPGSRVLYKGIIEGNTTLQFKLRVWLDDAYVLSSDKEYFCVDIDVQ